MYVMMVMSEGQEQGFIMVNDRLTNDISQAYTCVTKAGAMAVAEIFINRNPECDEVRITNIHTVAVVTRESAR